MKYYPIFVSKTAEIKALDRLKQEIKESTSPIIEITPDMFIDGWVEKKKKARAKADENRLKKGLEPIDRGKKKEKAFENALLTSLITHWVFPGNQILLDFTHCRLTLPQYIGDLLETLQLKKVNVVPVISATTSEDILGLALKFVVENDRPVCLRFDSNAFGKIASHDIFNRLSTNYGIGKDKIMLLLDGGYIEEHTYGLFKKYVLESLTGLPDIDSWREIIVSFGSFPKDLSDASLVARKEPYLLKRHEWAIWNDIRNASVCKGRVRYSDYGIKHPIYEDLSFQGTASIKYSDADSFVIYKGKKSGEDALGNAQYIAHAQELVKSEYYSGEEFSWGDELIMEYSKKSTKPQPPKKTDGKEKRPESGSAKDWIAIGQNHHICLISSLL